MPDNIIANLIRGKVKISSHPYEHLPVLLLSGVGRSGTTALRHCLSAHPDVHSTGTENNIIYDVLETARHNCTFPSRKGTMHIAPLAYERQFRILLLNLLWPEPRRGSARPDMLVASSDLTPDRAEYFRQAFPASRVAYIVRNGIAVVSSRMKHKHFCHEPFMKHCETWTNAAAMARWGDGREGIGIIRQESLIDAGQVKAALENLFEAVGLPFREACLSMVSENIFHPTGLGETKETPSDDLSGRSERWQEWTEDQRAMFVQICGAAMDELGYTIPWASAEEVRNGQAH